MVNNRKEYHKEYYLKNRDKYLQRAKSPQKREYDKQYNQRIKEQKRSETYLSNQSFIKDNGLREHPTLSGYYGTESGRVFSSSGSHGSLREIFPPKLKHGYHLMTCYKNGVRHQILQHQFIAQIFIPNPNNYLEINHKDENKSNNSVENLEWCTRQHNMEEYFKKERDNGVGVAKHYLIKNIKTGEELKVFNLSKWCRESGANFYSAMRIIQGKQKTMCNKTYTISKM